MQSHHVTFHESYEAAQEYAKRHMDEYHNVRIFQQVYDGETCWCVSVERKRGR